MFKLSQNIQNVTCETENVMTSMFKVKYSVIYSYKCKKLLLNIGVYLSSALW